MKFREGTRVRTTQDADKGGWIDPKRPGCKWGVIGTVSGHDSHGNCYEIMQDDKTFALYDYEELIVLVTELKTNPCEEKKRHEDECKKCGVMGQVNGLSCVCPQCGQIVWGI